jgi:hypothetical protein
MTDEVIVAAQQAWRRVRGNATFDDWVSIARGLAAGRAFSMKLAKRNKPVGTTYNRAMGQWLAQHGLDEISAQERYRALLVLDNLAAIESWRNALPEERRRTFNHPGAIWHAWQRRARPNASNPRQPDRRPGADQQQPAATPSATAPSASPWPCDEDALLSAIVAGLEQRWRTGDLMAIAQSVFWQVRGFLDPRTKDRARVLVARAVSSPATSARATAGA